MKAASIKELKEALKSRTPGERIELCLRLARFKKENKELLTYLLLELPDEAHYVESVKAEISGEFEQINTSSYYYIKKSVRKILRATKKYIRYSQQKETEVELLLHFCFGMKALRPSIFRNTVLRNLYERQLSGIEKAVSTLHEDLQYDFQLEIDRLREQDGG
ncbi:MAG: hypothetical protein H6557_20395 [Lewinellaceae bacterium]|nr:hypothetical protein [Lewinellaceae bacterium]